MKLKAVIKNVLLVMLLTTELFAQNDLITEPTLLYRKRLLYGANINSAELGGLNFKYQWQKTALLKNGFEIELARIRHPKEERIYGQSDNTRKYTPGRINMAFFIRTSYGQNVFITDRNYKNSISLHYNYSFGATTALLKPIYIEVIKPNGDPNSEKYLKATEKYDPTTTHTNPFLIYGNAAFTRGFSESTFVLGGHFKNSLSVEFGQYPDSFNSLEAGFVIDVFGKNLPLMTEPTAKNKNVFFTLFIGYSYGTNK